MLITTLFFVFIGLVCRLMNNISYNYPDIAAYIVIILTSIVFILTAAKQVRDLKLLQLILAGYFFRILLMICDLYWINLPNSGADSVTFHQRAIRYLDSGGTGGGINYSTFLGNIYRFFGPSEIIGRYVNILLGIFIIFILIKMLRRLEMNHKIIVLAVMIASFLPNFALLNVTTLRETLIAALLSLSLYFFILWFCGGKIRFFIISCILVLLAAGFHSGAVAPLPAYAITLILYHRNNKKLRINQKTIVLSILVFVAFIWINNSYGEDLFGRFNQIEDAEYLVNRQDSLRGRSGYVIGLNISNATLNLIVNTPIRILYFILSPMPWDWRGLGDVIAFTCSGMFYAYVFYIFIKTIKNSEIKYKSFAVILFVMCVASALIFAWGVKNAGTALRHRDKFVTQYILLFSILYSHKIPRRETENEKLKPSY